MRHELPKPPPIHTGAPGAPIADQPSLFKRGLAISYESLLHRLALLSPDATAPVMIIREQSGGVWKIKDVRLASDGVVEISIYPT